MGDGGGGCQQPKESIFLGIGPRLNNFRKYVGVVSVLLLLRPLFG